MSRVVHTNIWSAYGYARKAGYEGTEEEFEQGLKKSAEAAGNAEESAYTASEAATEADAARDAAAQSAESASTSEGNALEYANSAAQVLRDAQAVAQTVNAKATEAAGSASRAENYAQTATTKASEAATAAGTATTAATSASGSAQAADASATAAAASETNAAASASSALTSAGSASESADAAAASAEEAKAVQESIPEDYSQLSADVTDLKSAINADKSGYEYLETDWVIGIVDTTVGGTGEINTAFTNRIATNEILQFTRPLLFQIAAGYRFAIALMNSEGKVTANKTVTGTGNIGYYTLPANQRFKLMIYKDSPVTVDSIANYKKQLTFSTQQAEEINHFKSFIQVNPTGDDVFSSIFVRGSISAGILINGYDYRVVSTDIMIYPIRLHVKAKTGFKFVVQTYNSSSVYQLNSGFQTDYYIPADTYFRVCIARSTETTSEIADIPTFVKAVTIETYSTEQAHRANNDIASLSNTNTLKINTEWQRGYVNGGNYSNVSYTVRTIKCVKFDQDTLLRCTDQGFCFQLFEFTAETPSGSTYNNWYSGNLRGCYIVPKDKYYVIVVTRDPVDTSETADIDLFVSKLNIVPNIVRKANEQNDFWHMPAFGNTRQKIFGHKGITSTYPENTTASFEDAGQHGIFGIETDIQVTSDGYLICMHDTTVDRTTDGTGNVIDKTLEQIRTLHITGDETGLLKVPTIEEYLGICKRYGCVAALELKNMATNKTAVLKLVNTLKLFGMQKQSIITCSAYSIGYVQTITTDIPCMFNANDTDYSSVIDYAVHYPNIMIAYDVNTGTLTDAKIEELHGYGMPICVYIVNTSEDAVEFYGRGVDIITSDFLTTA